MINCTLMTRYLLKIASGDFDAVDVISSIEGNGFDCIVREKLSSINDEINVNL